MAINNIGTVHIARQIQAIRVYTNYINIKYVKAVVKNNIESIISKANGLIPGLKRELLLSLQIPLPPFAEQQYIVKEIERWFKLIDKIEQDKLNLQTVIKQVKIKNECPHVTKLAKFKLPSCSTSMFWNTLCRI